MNRQLFVNMQIFYLLYRTLNIVYNSFQCLLRARNDVSSEKLTISNSVIPFQHLSVEIHSNYESFNRTISACLARCSSRPIVARLPVN